MRNITGLHATPDKLIDTIGLNAKPGGNPGDGLIGQPRNVTTTRGPIIETDISQAKHSNFKIVNEEIKVDMDKIVQIESNNKPEAENKRTGARGLTQIMKPTWKEMTGKMDADWSWDEAFDSDKNLKVGAYYMNTEIPRLLKRFSLPDTIETRLAAYNWGIGHLRKTYINNPNEWLEYVPKETSDYIKKYLK